MVVLLISIHSLINIAEKLIKNIDQDNKFKKYIDKISEKYNNTKSIINKIIGRA